MVFFLTLRNIEFVCEEHLQAKKERFIIEAITTIWKKWNAIIFCYDGQFGAGYH
jgi:hypothetical protein